MMQAKSDEMLLFEVDLNLSVDAYYINENKFKK